jgi:hypothetical protein
MSKPEIAIGQIWERHEGIWANGQTGRRIRITSLDPLAAVVVQQGMWKGFGYGPNAGVKVKISKRALLKSYTLEQSAAVAS